MGLFGTDFLSSGVRGAQKAKDTIAGVKLPKAADLQLHFEQLVQQGVITPEQYQALMAPDSGLLDIEEDPTLRAAQADALGQYQDIADSDGLSATAQASLYRAQRELDSQNKGAQEAIMENARARGLGGSGLEFTNRLLAQQAGATRAAGTAVDTAALAEQNRDAARAAVAQLAGGMRSADFGIASRKAEAQDVINRFNTQTAQDVANRNIATANAAQTANLGEKQRIADSNVDTRNEQQRINKLETPLKLTDLRMRKAGALADAQNAVGQAREQRADRGQEIIKQVGDTVGKMMMSDRRVKKDVRPFDSRKVFEDVSGYKFRYSDPALDTGEEESSVMADEFQKVLPAAVKEGPDGLKRIDMGDPKVGGLILAAIADMNKRMSDVEDRGGKNG